MIRFIKSRLARLFQMPIVESAPVDAPLPVRDNKGRFLKKTTARAAQMRREIGIELPKEWKDKGL